MARNKNSTALFDVIHAAKKLPKSSPSASIPAPRWWGKDKQVPKTPVPKAAQTDPTENVGKQRSWLSAARQNAAAIPAQVQHAADSVDVDPTEPVESAADVDPVQITPAPEPAPAAPRTRFIDRFVNRAPRPEPVAEVATETVVSETAVESAEPLITADPAALPLPVFYKESETPAEKPEKRPARRDSRDSAVAVNSVLHEIQFRLSYGGMAAVAMIIAIALVIAFLAGRRASSDSAMIDGQPAGVPTTATTPQTSGMMAATGTKPAMTPEPVKPALRPDVINVPPAPKPAVKEPRPPVVDSHSPALLPIKAVRDVGKTYVVFQSYPDEQVAQRACDFVNRNGVKATLVRGLTEWAPRDFYSVVGLQAFKAGDPAIQAYKQNASALGVRFSHDFLDQFQPHEYPWRADSDANNVNGE